MSSLHQTPTIAPHPSATGATAAPSPRRDSKAVNPRILRKREADRKCQRLIRERTKSRIADLESTVKEYERKDASGLAILMRQLAEAREERDALAKKVENIGHLLNDGRLTTLDNGTLQGNSPDNNAAHLSDPYAPDSPDGDRPESRNGSLDDKRLIDIPSYTRDAIQYTQEQIYVTTPRFEALPFLDSSASTLQDASPGVLPTAILGDINPISARHDQAREGMTAPDAQIQKYPFNIWRYATEVLSSRFQWPVDYNQTIADNYVDDTPVRVVLEGWEAVERRGPVHPSWQILKRIDQAMFWQCEPRERLAVLYTMHVLFQSHSDPAISDIPSFFQKGPFRLEPDFYAINFLTWPGVRQRFFDNQHLYTTNEFWKVFTRNLRVLWPFEFRDCYARNVETGLYTISPLFRDRIGDINSWAMAPEMFQRWPEFYSDIPTFNTIPGSIQNKVVARNIHAVSGRTLARGHVYPPTSLSSTNQDPDQDPNQNAHGIRHNWPESRTRQVSPVPYGSMTWTQLVPSPYSHFDYTPGSSALNGHYPPPFL